MERVRVKGRDGYSLDVHLFEIPEPEGVVQIIHGMEEHQERYEPFVRFLNQNGYTVLTSDMRGHGASAPVDGFFKEKKGYEELIEDQRAITRFITKRYPNSEICLFAHSMGTVITRVLLQTDSRRYAKAILSGFPNYRAEAYAGIAFAKLVRLFHGPRYKSSVLEYMAVGAFNKKIRNPKTPFDWIAANEEAVRKYIADPHCGSGFTCSAFNDLFHLVIRMHDAARYRDVNKDLRLLMLRGSDDPCVGGDKGAADSIDVLAKAGFADIHEIEYPRMRHEILSEADHAKVYSDILAFLKSTTHHGQSFGNTRF